jgi:hypothetical protein
VSPRRQTATHSTPAWQGAYELTVAGRDGSGASNSRSVRFTVFAPGDTSATVTGGDTVSTGTTATPDAAAADIDHRPPDVSGSLTVDAQRVSNSPTGYQLFGQQLVIEGPVASVASPYEVSFTVDSTQLAGIAPADVQVFRNGVAVTGCTHPSSAVPDPCIVSRGYTPDRSGDALVTVRTSHFSTWTLGRLQYALKGPLLRWPPHRRSTPPRRAPRSR